MDLILYHILISKPPVTTISRELFNRYIPHVTMSLKPLMNRDPLSNQITKLSDTDKRKRLIVLGINQSLYKQNQIILSKGDLSKSTIIFLVVWNMR
jgi:hypothetical protein